MGGALEGTSAEGSLPKAIGNIETQVTDKLKENNLGSEIDEQNTFTAPFSQITSKLKEIAGLIDSEKKDPGPAPGDGQKNGVNNYLNDITSMLGQVSTVNLTSDIKEKHTDVQGLAHIQSELQKLHIQVPQVTNLLMQLCSTVGNNAYYAKKSLTQLKNEYFVKSTEAKNSILKIYSQLDDLHNEIKVGPIHDAEEFLKFAEQAEQHFSKILKEQVENDIKDAEKALTSHARQQYVDSIKSLLQAFADKAQDELSPLPKLIDEDLKVGFKGFMKAVEGEVTEGETTGENINKLSSRASDSVDSPDNKKTAFANLSQKFKEFYNNLHLYVNKQVLKVYDYEKEKNPSGTPAHDYPRKLSTIYDALNELLIHLSRNSRFDCHVPALLDGISGALVDLKPQDFATVTTPVLDVMVSGVGKYVDELREVYISAYDSVTFEGLLCTEETKTDDAGQTKKLTHLTDHGRKCAKVFLTLLCTLLSSLTILKHNCKSLTKQQINKSTDVGRHFAELGFTVSDDGKQNGELHDTSLITGEYIANSLTFRIKNADKIEHLKTCLQNRDKLTNIINIFDILKCIYHHFEEYNEVCHIASSSSKSPCSVYEMLVWLTGLPYTAANSVMRHATITELFENPDKQVTDGEISGTLVGDSPIKAQPYDITFNKVIKAIDHVCSKSYGILTTVAGHGDADTTYGSDLCNNSLRLRYPSSGEDCFQMLLDVLWRLLPALRYLQTQCVLNDKYSGWANCQYGKGVPPSNWPCTDHPSDEAKCQANCQANGKPTCRPTSPLQSYLNDSLVGHLPHRVTSIGCRSVCSNCPRNKPGMPCLTPMGFRGFSGSAKTGKDIYDMINTFFGTGLISSVLCLVPKPPSTLAEHFSFASSLVKDWQYGGSTKENDLQSCIETSIDKLSIRLIESRSKFTNTLRDAYGSSSSSHSAQGHVAAYTDLASLSRNATCSGLDVQCGPYLQSTCHDAYNYLAHKHSDTYLSWAIYLPWTFYSYLKALLDAFQQIDCGSFCCRGCPCKPGSHGKEANCKCNTIVGCRGVAPTFYRYGFTLGDAQALMRTDSVKNCANFVTQLKALLNSNYFKTLLQKCDEFIFTIRAPFIWLNIALWSLSLFYLLCVMVGRLDLLHIRSHLRIPSSHKITAQSLLAAAQVGRLAKISYLQP
ncbi:hypothetical protein, conserved [Babesia bigemina]|uniref:C3H1-type domain-containing protein n=1 Tax=Babesia bigemina TaxID=5866 RepID=A0A061BS63_BABBI|nr:hypothetical protein, conserved [Babesia bigemina]CDR71396.1 hypothetical protein, conserved [Babesia bigemina]|eukprot:XP_012770346.1 hypothetical protein, conserved [Babesia bigemina]